MLKRITVCTALFVTVFLSAGGVSPTLAASQEQVQLPTLIWIVRNEYEPGQSAPELLEEYGRAYQTAGWTRPFLSLTALFGNTDESLRVFGFDSFADLEREQESLAQASKFSSQLASIDRAAGKHLRKRDSIIGMYRADLSYRPDKINLARSRYLELTTFLVSPGRQADFVEARRIQVAAHKRANMQEEAWAIYQIAGGAPIPTFLVVLPMRDLGEMDQGPSLHGAAFQQALAQESGEKARTLDAGGIVSGTGNIYAIVPNASYVSAEFAAHDPEYWRRAFRAEPASEKRQ